MGKKAHAIFHEVWVSKFFFPQAKAAAAVLEYLPSAPLHWWLSVRVRLLSDPPSSLLVFNTSETIALHCLYNLTSRRGGEGRGGKVLEGKVQPSLIVSLRSFSH